MQEEGGKKKAPRLAELDYLRIFAAVSVLIYHYSLKSDRISGWGATSLQPVTQFGYLGVELFFIISGFVIFMSASGRTWTQFVRARAVRLVPMFLLAGPITWVIVNLSPYDRLHRGIDSLISHFTIIPLTPLQYIYQKLDILPVIDGVYWSLWVECTFYILITLAIVTGLIKKPRMVLWTWLAITALALPLRGALRMAVDLTFITEYSPYFIAGALFNLVHAERSRRWDDMAGLVAAFGLGVMSALQGSVDREVGLGTSDPIRPYVTVVLIAVMFVPFALISYGKGFAKVTKVSSALGGATYLLYLLHQNIGYVLMPIIAPLVGGPAALFILLVLMVSFCVLMNQKVEPPLSAWFKQLLDRALPERTKKPSSEPA